MAASRPGCEPHDPRDERAALLDECVALSALCMDLALAGARQRTGRDPLVTGEPFLTDDPPPRITRI